MASTLTGSMQTLALIAISVAIPFVKQQIILFQTLRRNKSRSFSAGERLRIQTTVGAVVIFAVLAFKNWWLRESNIYKLTSSRLATSVEVLIRRLQRDSLSQITVDDVLRKSLEMRSGVLAYLRYGSTPLVECNWCTPDVPNSYLYFVLGQIILEYVGHLSILAIITVRKTFVFSLVALALACELYVRAGGLDYYNNRSKTSEDILFVHSYVVLFRGCFFVMSMALTLADNYLKAKYFGLQIDQASIRKALLAAIEKMRVNNSMQRAIGDHAPLRTVAATFWSANETSTNNLNHIPCVINARASARDRLRDVTEERTRTREFVLRVTQSS